MKFCHTLLFTSLLGIQSIANADDYIHSLANTDDHQSISSTKGNAGFGIGAVIGGLLAGPPGIVVGAVGGSWFASRETKADKAIATLEKELNTKSMELAYQQNKLANIRENYKTRFQRVVHSQEVQSLERLCQGISYVIYYKTNDAEIRPDVRPQIQQLVELIKPYPQIQIQIEGHADYRGSEDYNMALSKKRIDKVRSEFINAGISNQRLHTHAYGERKTTAKQR